MVFACDNIRGTDQCRLVLVIVLTFALLSSTVKAQDVFLDASFGDRGIVITDVAASIDFPIYGTSDYIFDAVVLAGGDVLVSGTSNADIGNPSFTFARYHSNGGLDSTFGRSGIVTTDLGNYSYPLSLATLPGGKFLAVGTTRINPFRPEIPAPCVVLARYRSSGTLDSSFGQAGVVTTFDSTSEGFSSVCVITDSVVQPDGMILVSVFRFFSFGHSGALLRYTSEGALDSMFGEAGIVLDPITRNGFVGDLWLQSDGKMLVAGAARGATQRPYHDGIAVARYHSNGAIDSEFGDAGIAIIPRLGGAAAFTVTQQDDGKIIIAGGTYAAPVTYLENGSLIVARFNEDGSLDETFGDRGTTITTTYAPAPNPLTYQSDEASDMLLQADGKILVAGVSYSAYPATLSAAAVLVRYNADGTLDMSFGGNGLVSNDRFRILTSLSQPRAVFRLGLQPGGRLVGVTTAHERYADFALLRYSMIIPGTDSTPDPTIRPSYTMTPDPTPSTPTASPTPSPTSTSTSTPQYVSYVALGDSYSSGEGVIPYFPGSDTGGLQHNRCHRSFHGYPTLVQVPGAPKSIYAMRDDPRIDWRFLACSGAVTDNVRSGGLPPHNGPNELPQLDQDPPDPFVNRRTTLISITIGGDDAGFAPVLEACFAFEPCQDVRPFEDVGDTRTYRELFPIFIDRYVKPRVFTLYREILNRARNAAVYGLGYPRLMGGRECVDSEVRLGSLVVAKLSQSEQFWIREIADKLNVAIAGAAFDAGVDFVEVSNHFSNHEVCGSSEPWISGVRLPIASSFHPNLIGQAQYASVLNRAIAAGSKANVLSHASANRVLAKTDVSNPEPVDFNLTASPTFGRLSIKPSSAGCPLGEFVTAGQSFEVEGEGFSPNSDIVVRLSFGAQMRVSLGTISADELGRIRGPISLPRRDELPRAALVEALGRTSDGTAMLLTHFVVIIGESPTDTDTDRVPDACDNCPLVANAQQEDRNGNGIGDRCDVKECPGDCRGDGDVTVDEIVKMIRIALNVDPGGICVAGDRDFDGSIAIDEIIAAVNNLLKGCEG